LAHAEAERRRGRMDPAGLARALAAARDAGNVSLTCILRLRQASLEGPARLATIATQVLDEARQQPYRPTRIVAASALAQALADQGDAAGARRHALEAAGLMDGCEFGMLYKPELLLGLHKAFSVAGDGANAQRMLDLAWAWVQQRALPHVPEPFLSSFLDRQPVNLALRGLHRR